ncbi:MAG: hypothetical protein AB1325_13460 [Nitrospirota bacterium]
MRKQYKKKKRSCKLCKPHKMGIEKRWKPQEAEQIRIAEKQIRSIANNIEESVLEWVEAEQAWSELLKERDRF